MSSVFHAHGVSFDLEPKGEDVLLTVIHRAACRMAPPLMFGAGWHRPTFWPPAPPAGS
jgi:hypothetical protein